MNITKILKNIAKMYEVLYNRGNEGCKENTKKIRDRWNNEQIWKDFIDLSTGKFSRSEFCFCGAVSR